MPVTEIPRHRHTGNDSERVSYNDLQNRPPELTQAEKDALAGSSGTPSSTNTYITEDDVVVAATASKVVRRGSSGEVTVPAPSAGGDATNKTYVDTTIVYAVASDTIQFRKQSGIDLNTAENIKVFLPGVIRLKLYIKSNNDPTTTLNIYSKWLGGDEATHLRYSNASIAFSGYNYYSTDISVSAGEVISIVCSSSTTTDLQVNFTPTVMSDTYVLDI